MGSEHVSSDSFARFVAFFLAHNVSCYTRSNGWNKTYIDLIFIPYFLLIYANFNQALNLNLNNLKFAFVFSYLLHSTFIQYWSYCYMYLMSVDDSISINLTGIMLIIEESGSIFKSFIRIPT